MKRSFAIMVRVDHNIKQATEQAALDDHRSVASLVQKLIFDYLNNSGYIAENDTVNLKNLRNESNVPSISPHPSNNLPGSVEGNELDHPTQMPMAHVRGGSNSVAPVDAHNGNSNHLQTTAKTGEDNIPSKSEGSDVDEIARLIRRVIKEELKDL